MMRFRKAFVALLVCCLLLGVAMVVGAEGEHKHSYTWEDISKATCDETGIKRGVCSCGDQIYEYPAALGHDWGEWVTTPATCTKTGSQVRTCKRDSSHTESITLPMLDHSMTPWQLFERATCTKAGKETRRCATCDTKPEEREIPATGHNWSPWQIEKTATCMETGLQKSHCLNGCGEKPKTQDVPKIDHNWSEYRLVKAAECEVDGSSESVCLFGCGTTPKTKVLPKLGHNLANKTVTKNATCIEKGQIKESCTRCSYFKLTDVPALGKNQPNGHKFGTWGSRVEPTCTKAGSEKRSCSDCGREETRSISMIPHKSNGIWVDEREATTKQMGLQVTHCSVCGNVASQRNVAPRNFRYEVATYAHGPQASEFPGGSSAAPILYLDLTQDSDQRYALVTEDGWLVGYARVTVAGGTVRVSVEKTVEANVMRYRAWGMFPDVTTARMVDYENSLPFDQAVKGPGEHCVITLNMLTNYYQGGANEKFSDGLMAPGSGMSYQELYLQMLQMSEQSGE